MKIKFTAPAIVALMAITACQRSNDAPGNDVPQVANDTPMANVEMAPGASDKPAVATNEVSNAAIPAKLPTSIPAQFHGRWGLNKADCTSTRGDAKGLLTISDARLTFYESRGTLDKILGATATSFDAHYSFAGERQTWARTERLKLVDGKVNRRTDAEPDQEPPVNLTYNYC